MLGKVKDFLWSAIKTWANADGQEEGEYADKATCKPNCDSKKGGPPITTVAYCVIYIVMFYTYGFDKTYSGFLGRVKAGYTDPCNVASWGNTTCSGTIEVLPFTDVANTVYTQMPIEQFMGEFDEDVCFNPSRRGEIWRYFTYQFLHVSTLHLWLNVCILALAGIPLELVHDGYIVFGIHTAGVIMGAMFQYWVNNGIMVGASGGVYAVLFLHISNMIINGESFSPKYIVMQLVLNLPLLALFLYDLIKAFIDTSGNVSYAGHLAGIFTALTLGVAVLRNFNVQKWEKAARAIQLLLFCTAFVCLFLIQFKDFEWKSSFNALAGGVGDTQTISSVSLNTYYGEKCDQKKIDKGWSDERWLLCKECTDTACSSKCLDQGLYPDAWSYYCYDGNPVAQCYCVF